MLSAGLLTWVCTNCYEACGKIWNSYRYNNKLSGYIYLLFFDTGLWFLCVAIKRVNSSCIPQVSYQFQGEKILDRNGTGL